MATERKPKAPHLDFSVTYKVWNMSFQLKYTYSSIIIGKEKKRVCNYMNVVLSARESLELTVP